LRLKKPEDVPRWDDVMTWDGTKVTTTQPILLDFGAVGKGYLVDLVAELLEQRGVGEYVIDASGDIRHHGGNEQIIGLENPMDPSLAIGTAKLQNASLCASATNRRKWGNGLHHVIDGRTGKPTDDVIATWVVADTTAAADGLATALFFVGAERLKDWKFQYVRLHSDGKIEHSHDFVGELFI
jgi:thiamine biosynthesis lipoprotein